MENTTKEIAREILLRANSLAPNSNFEIQGFNQARFMCAIQATLDVLNEKGLLSGCLLCKTTNKEKEES